MGHSSSCSGNRRGSQLDTIAEHAEVSVSCWAYSHIVLANVPHFATFKVFAASAHCWP
jgi:hypothetical protein